jgi:hypothetical protein
MKDRTARQVLFVAAIMGVSSLSVGQELAPAGSYADPASVQVEQLTSAQLADLVAPIALYPDALLSQVLVASTYPLDVVQAQQWMQRNGHLQGQALMDAARQQPWDASVQGLVAFPDALATLNEDIRWTTDLGNAFLAQEASVMVAVQDLRVRAQAAGRLSSTPQQLVSEVAEEGRTVIEIVPADPLVIYVPRYDPYYVWGSPAWVSYPRLSYGYGYGFGPGIDVGFWFGGWSWGRGWGWGPNWWGGSVWVDRVFFRHCGYNYGRHGGYYGGRRGGYYDGYRGGTRGGYEAGRHSGRETWKHDTGSRKGVPYGNGRDAGRSRGGSLASGSVLTDGGSSRRSGSLSASPSGDRAASAAPRGAGRDEGWRTPDRTRATGSRDGGTDQARRTATRAPAPGSGSVAPDQGWRTRSGMSASGSRSVAPDQGRRTTSGTVASAPRSIGADRGWSSSAEVERGRPQGVSRGQNPPARQSMSTRRDTPSSSRSTASQPRNISPPYRGMETSQRSQSTQPRSSASSPRSSAPSSGYSAPSRSSSRATSDYSAPSRSSSSGSGGRSTGAGSPQRSTSGSGSRGSSGSRSTRGNAGGDGRRH